MRPANPYEVLRLVAEYNHVEVREITGGSHVPHVVIARYQAIGLIVQMSARSWGTAQRLVGLSPDSRVRKSVGKLNGSLPEVEAYVRDHLEIPPDLAPSSETEADSLSNKIINPLPLERGVGGGSNPRALGTNPRSLGTNPRGPSVRQTTKAEKRVEFLARVEAWTPDGVEAWFHDQSGTKAINLVRSVAEFKDYCRCRSDVYYDSLDAAFRNRIRNELKGTFNRGR